ncbi:MAG TPA: ABC transporter ATP-binding protein [Alkalispirochaeta sp.]|nr:ABC transporter ATP-binding protein [Alkalispirochaeta sp.]
MILTVEKLRKVFGGLVAVNDVDLSVQKGSIHAIIGPNGAGKTTFFNALTRLVPADSGAILFEEQSLAKLSTHQIAGVGIARTFQNIRLFPYLSVLENVKVGSHTREKHNVFEAMFRLPRFRREEAEVESSALSLLKKVGLYEKRDAYARNLPYGEQRKLEIARALAAEPRLLLLDEPAAGMNASETASLDNFIRFLRDDGYTILLIEHDMKLIMSIADTISVMDHGVKIAEGSAKEVQSNEQVIEAYLGRTKE